MGKASAFVDNLYCKIFSREVFQSMHKLIYQLSLKGMGININGGISMTGETLLFSKFLNKYNKEDTVIFDVGANVGGYSKLLATYLPKAKVYAFEPVSVNIKAYNKIHGSNKNIELVPMGAGEKNSKEFIYYPKCDGPSALPSLHDVFKNNEDLQKEKVEIIKLDDFCKKRGIKKIDLIKLDIEGNELAALKGAKKMIKEGKIKIIQFEFNFINVYSRVWMEDFKDLLKDYEFYRILPKGLAKVDFSKKIFSEIYGYQNILAVYKNEKK
jgi:FkbM family methyltransferase